MGLAGAIVRFHIGRAQQQLLVPAHVVLQEGLVVLAPQLAFAALVGTGRKKKATVSGLPGSLVLAGDGALVITEGDVVTRGRDGNPLYTQRIQRLIQARQQRGSAVVSTVELTAGLLATGLGPSNSRRVGICGIGYILDNRRQRLAAILRGLSPRGGLVGMRRTLRLGAFPFANV